MHLTVGDIRKKIKDLPDDALVYMERIEDFYFEKHNWKTETLIFQRDKNGVIIESADIFNATQVQTNGKRLIIYAHY